MKFFITTTLLVITAGTIYAGSPVITEQKTESLSHTAHSSPLDHGPAGIMGDHLHAKGEWMLGYHYMRMEMNGHRQGTDELSLQEVFDLGYTAAAENMIMDMHMFEVMYAPTDWLTLMVMANYIFNDMDMVMSGGRHGHGDHMMPMMNTGTMRHSHSTEGWGDTSLSALFPIYRNETGTRIIGSLGISAPTGDVEVKNGSNYTHYDMQLGSGTWDLLPGITATQRIGDWQLGAQLGAVIRLEEEGDSGYRKGHRFFVDTWIGYEVTEWLGLNATLSASSEGAIEGHYNGPHNHNAPNDFQANYGGEIVDAGIGANLLTPSSWGALFGSQRVGVRATVPVYQDLNGVGMNSEWTLFVSWQKAF